MEEIKFRFWNRIVGRMTDSFTLPELHTKDVAWDNLVPLRYSGRKDDQGVEIFQGDIIEYVRHDFDEDGDLKNLLLVIWDTETASFKLKMYNDRRHFCTSGFGFNDDRVSRISIKVIGNQFKNSGLLPNQKTGAKQVSK